MPKFLSTLLYRREQLCNFCFSSWLGLRKESWNKSWNECKIPVGGPHFLSLVLGLVMSDFWGSYQRTTCEQTSAVFSVVSSLPLFSLCPHAFPTPVHGKPGGWYRCHSLLYGQEMKYNADVLSGEKEMYFRMKQVRVLNDFCHLLVS